MKPIRYTAEDHTFVICAYGESEYLEDCIRSLKAQTVPTRLLMATSTPNALIRSLSEKYGIPLFVNHGESGIGGDWNFAAGCAETALVTIAHQDDIYEPTYAAEMIDRMSRSARPIIAFSKYAELRGDQKVYRNRLLRIKNFLLFPLRFSHKSVFIRRRVLSFGCPICCPSVTYRREVLAVHSFRNDFKSDLDWQMWETLSKEKGEFLYLPKPLMCHRIHEESATSEIIGDNIRTKEDYQMFRKFWPNFIAKRLAGFYAASEKSNSLD